VSGISVAIDLDKDLTFSFMLSQHVDIFKIMTQSIKVKLLP